LSRGARSNLAQVGQNVICAFQHCFSISCSVECSRQSTKVSYLRRGWPVIPLVSGQKRPLVPQQDQIIAWWSNTPFLSCFLPLMISTCFARVTPFEPRQHCAKRRRI
jgi:hypothetical protein